MISSQQAGSSRCVILKTDHPVAIDSVDHLHPLGTIQDNHRSPIPRKAVCQLSWSFEYHSNAILLQVGTSKLIKIK